MFLSSAAICSSCHSPFSTNDSDMPASMQGHYMNEWVQIALRRKRPMSHPRKVRKPSQNGAVCHRWLCTASAVRGSLVYVFRAVYVLDCVEISSCQSFLAHKSIERNEVTPLIITSDQSRSPISKSITPPHVRENHARWSLQPFPIKYSIVLTQRSRQRTHKDKYVTQGRWVTDQQFR